MPVTQDYKILTLTSSEYAAVHRALIQREIHLSDMISLGSKDDQAYQKHMLHNLEPVQSALAKVGKHDASMTIIDGPTGNVIQVLPKASA